ncbi:hypothetical protein GCM10009000_077050 [Halobacterium noricense]|uniref:Uncharacterized protein n=1 Tax=Haladaptatus pallidirubidus TaxID=1008152 RepID=A0AAV3UMU6_9EURY
MDTIYHGDGIDFRGSFCAVYDMMGVKKSECESLSNSTTREQIRDGKQTGRSLNYVSTDHSRGELLREPREVRSGRDLNNVQEPAHAQNLGLIQIP